MGDKLRDIKANPAGAHHSHTLAHFDIAAQHIYIADDAGMIYALKLWNPWSNACGDYHMVKTTKF